MVARIRVTENIHQENNRYDKTLIPFLAKTQLKEMLMVKDEVTSSGIVSKFVTEYHKENGTSIHEMAQFVDSAQNTNLSSLNEVASVFRSGKYARGPLPGRTTVSNFMRNVEEGMEKVLKTDTDGSTYFNISAKDTLVEIINVTPELKARFLTMEQRDAGTEYKPIVVEGFIDGGRGIGLGMELFFILI